MPYIFKTNDISNKGQAQFVSFYHFNASNYNKLKGHKRLQFCFWIVCPYQVTWPYLHRRSTDGAVVRALASHQCDPGSNRGVDAVCGLSLLFVLSFPTRGFSPGTPVFWSPQKPTFPNSNSIRNQVDEEPLSGCATSKSLYIVIYLYISSTTI